MARTKQVLSQNRATASGGADAPQRQAAVTNRRRPVTKKIRMGSLNVGTMKEKVEEVIEMMIRRRLEVLSVQETKWKGDRARVLSANFKIIHAGGDGISNGVGVIVNEDIAKNIIRVERWNGRIILVWLMAHKQIFCIASAYAPQVNRPVAEKREFRENLERMVNKVDATTVLCLAGDFNAHLGKAEEGEEECVGKHSWGTRNRDGQELVDLMMRNGLVEVSTFMEKRESHKITYRSGQHKSVVDMLLVKTQQRSKVKDCKAVPGEHTASQHKPLIYTIRLEEKKNGREKGRKTIRWWKCREDIAREYVEKVRMEFGELSDTVEDLEEEWRKYRKAFVGTAEALCGRTKGRTSRRKNQEWWTKEVASAIKEKRDMWKQIEEIKVAGGYPSRQMQHRYGTLKNKAKKAVGKARKERDSTLYHQLEEDGGRKLIYKLAKERDENSTDVKGGSSLKDTEGRVVFEEEQVMRIWEKYFYELLNPNINNDNNIDKPFSVRGKMDIRSFSADEVQRELSKMKNNKAPGPDELKVEMIKATGEVGIKWTTRLLNACISEGRIPKEWRTGLVVPIWKKKGDVQDPSKYRGITLLSQGMKLLERILDKRMRVVIEGQIGEEQQGFRPGRGTTDGMFAIRQVIEKRMEKQKGTAVCFVDLEKAYDTVSRELVYATLRWMGVQESEVRMVEGLYEDTKARVLVGGKTSKEFEVKVGLRQGSALSPLLFIAVMELVSRKRGGETLEKLLYADDLALIAKDRDSLEALVEDWRAEFVRQGLRISVEKTEVLWCGTDRTQLSIQSRGRELKQVQSFCYLGGMIDESGKAESEVRRRIQAGANAWRKVEGVMVDRNISKKVKGKVLTTCVIPACIYGLETVALTEEQTQRLQVCENNWVRKINGTRRHERKRLGELRATAGINVTLSERVRRNRLRWAGHMWRMGEERAPKRAFQMEVEGTRRRGRPNTRWEDTLKRDLEGSGVRDWKREAEDRRRWKDIVNQGQP